jgi:hypothetical protein
VKVPSSRPTGGVLATSIVIVRTVSSPGLMSAVASLVALLGSSTVIETAPSGKRKLVKLPPSSVRIALVAEPGKRTLALATGAPVLSTTWPTTRPSIVAGGGVGAPGSRGPP